MVSKFNNYIRIQKSIKSAIQTLNFFFRSSSVLDSKYKHNFLLLASKLVSKIEINLYSEIDQWARSEDFKKNCVLTSSSGLVSEFKNYIRIQKSIKSAIQTLNFFFRSSSVLDSKYKHNFLLLASKLVSKIEINLYSEIDQWARSEDFKKNCVLTSSSGLVSEFKNYIRIQKSIKSAIQTLNFFFRSSSVLDSKYKHNLLNLHQN